MKRWNRRTFVAAPPESASGRDRKDIEDSRTMLHSFVDINAETHSESLALSAVVETLSDVRKFLAGLSTGSTLSVFDHAEAFGVVVNFSEAEFGFGEITLSVDKTTGEALCDLEEMSPATCGKFLMRSVGTLVVDIATPSPEGGI